FNIKMLRRALSDDAHEPRFIETVPRRGYRFIAEVKEGFSQLGSKAESDERSSERGRFASRRLYLSIAVLLALVAGSLLIFLSIGRTRLVASSSSAPILSAPFKSENFSTSGRAHAIITPDGKYVAYTNETGGKESIWLRKLETSENIQIVPPSNESYIGLAISHDGNSL